MSMIDELRAARAERIQARQQQGMSSPPVSPMGQVPQKGQTPQHASLALTPEEKKALLQRIAGMSPDEQRQLLNQRGQSVGSRASLLPNQMDTLGQRVAGGMRSNPGQSMTGAARTDPNLPAAGVGVKQNSRNPAYWRR